MKNYNQIRIAIRSIIFCLTLLFYQVFSLMGQANYVDIVPDAKFESDKQIQIDINNDGEKDFEFKFWQEHSNDTWTYSMEVMTSSDGQIAISDGFPIVINANDTIDEDLEWNSGSSWQILSGYTYGYGQHGNWVDVDHGFLGVRVKNNSNYHYAWIRLIGREGMAYQYRWIADYGIEEVADQPITAGQSLPIAATSVYAKDNHNYFDGRDIEVSFAKPYIDSVFTEFRIVVAKASDTSAYELDVMNQLPDSLYYSVIINSTNLFPIIIQYLIEETLDKDGDSIEKFVEYRIHLLNIASSSNSNDNVLSAPSPAFYLQATTLPVNKVVACDAGSSQTAGDIKVFFPKIDNESFLQEYRIFILLEEDTVDFNVEMALALSSEYYTAVQPTGNDIAQSLNPDQKTIYGNTIDESIFYQAVVLSFADSIYSITSSLSKRSRKFIMEEPGFLLAGQKTGDNIEYYLCDSLFSNSSYWGDSVYIDLNRDGLNDFILTYIHNLSPMSEYLRGNLKAERNNLVLVCNHEGHENWIDVLNKHETINEEYYWSNETSILIGYVNDAWTGQYYSKGHIGLQRFLGPHPYYIGFCIVDYEKPQYAWLQLEARLFLDYAFQEDYSVNPEVSELSRFTLYPNPSVNHFYLESKRSEFLNKDIYVKIFNTHGVIIDVFTLKGGKGKHDISNYSKGIYLCLIFDNKQIIETKRFMVY